MRRLGVAAGAVALVAAGLLVRTRWGRAPAATHALGGAAPAASAVVALLPTASASTPPLSPSRPPRVGTSSTLPCFDDRSTDDWLPRGTSVDTGLDGKAVDALIADAMRTETDALLVVKDGVVVVERYFGARGPIETRSTTKSIVGLAVLALVADGKIPSLDAPLSTWYREFGEGGRAAITLRHVLTHTSGLLHGDDADALNAAPDRLAYARTLRVVSEPGTVFSYSNEATELLSGIIESAAGMPVEDYVRTRLFEPLGIREFTWARDRSGKVQMYYGLAMHARDLARVGMLLLDEGRVAGRSLLPVDLVHEAILPGRTNVYFGLLHWLLFRGTTTRLGYLDPPKGPQIGFFAVGGLGQRYAVYPEARLVAVRQHRRRGKGKPYEDLVTWRGMFDRLEAMDPVLASAPSPGASLSPR